MYDFNQKPDLNITPLVDVMLVLLAILMITAPVIEFEEPVNLPNGSKSQQIKDIKKISVLITKDRKILIGKNSYELENFADSFILFSNDKNKDTPIHIRADKRLIYDDVIFVLKTVKEAGFFKVSLITDG